MAELTAAQARTLKWAESLDGKTSCAGFANLVSWAHSAGYIYQKPLSPYSVRIGLTDAGRSALAQHREASRAE